MAVRASITFALSALEDLEELQAYYRQEGLPEAGMRLISGSMNSIKRLSSHPLSGRIVPEFMVNQLREIIFPPLRIVYRFDRRRVRIVRIWRSERLMKLP